MIPWDPCCSDPRGLFRSQPRAAQATARFTPLPEWSHCSPRPCNLGWARGAPEPFGGECWRAVNQHLTRSYSTGDRGVAEVADAGSPCGDTAHLAAAKGRWAGRRRGPGASPLELPLSTKRTAQARDGWGGLVAEREQESVSSAAPRPAEARTPRPWAGVSPGDLCGLNGLGK